MDWKTKEKKRLVEAVLALESPDEARRFLRDLMTEGEIDEFAKRLKAAEMLSQKITYTAIEKKTGLSSTTVARISKWLNGEFGGYRLIINRTQHHSPRHTGRGLS
jgi:TrpR-related protein YerC/YecD